MLRVLTSATTTEGLVTTDRLRQLLGVSASSESPYDETYALLTVKRASAWAETQLGRPLALQTYQETVPAFGGRRLTLSRTPVLAVTRFFDSTSTGEATPICSSEFRIEDREAGFLTRDLGWAWSADPQFGEAAPFALGLTESYLPMARERRPYLIEYIAGYRVACSTATCHGLSTGDEAWTTGQTLPEDLEAAILMKAKALYQDLEGVARRRVGDFEIAYQAAGPGVAADPAEALLAPYRRWA